MSASTPLESAAIAQAAVLGSPTPHEWLTFRIAEEEYGIDILQVQEIRSYEKPTRIANMPEYVKGVVNLRGVIVPILDLRMRLGVADLRYDDLTVTIVLNVNGQVIGTIVDSVSDVLELPPSDIKAFPGLDSSAGSRFITGIGSLKHDGRDRMLILLDIEALIGGSTVEAAVG